MQKWLEYQKKKWELQRKQRHQHHKRRRLNNNDVDDSDAVGVGGVVRTGTVAGLGGFLRRKERTMLDTPWQIVQVGGGGDMVRWAWGEVRGCGGVGIWGGMC